MSTTPWAERRNSGGRFFGWQWAGAVSCALVYVFLGGVREARANVYSSADLVGTWHRHALTTTKAGAAPGWDSGAGWAYGSGTVTADGVYSGSAQEYLKEPSADVTAHLGLNDKGEFTVEGGSTSHGHMAADKNLIAMVSDWSGSDVSEMGLITRQGASYKTADLAGSWVGRAIASGPGTSVWQQCSVTMTTGGVLSVTSRVPSLAKALPLPARLDLNEANGVVTVAGASDPAASGFWHGHMAAGKSTVVLVNTWDADGSVQLVILTRLAAACTASDLAGTWYAADIASSPGAPWWEWGSLTVDGTGKYVGQLLEYNSDPDDISGQLTVSAAGVVRLVGKPTAPGTPGYWQGQLSASKNTIIANGTWSTEYPGNPEFMVLTRGIATPVLTWANPAAIVYGTALSASQLNAKASVPGKFAYSPALGAKLPAGINALSVTFTPTDTNRYGTAEKAVALVVNRAAQTLTFRPLPVVALGVTNFSPGASASSGQPVEYTSSNEWVAQVVDGMLQVLGAGTSVITASQPGTGNYKAAAATQTLTVKARLNAGALSGGGTVSGGGLYVAGAGVSLTARPSAGYTLLHWEDGSQALSRSYTMSYTNAWVWALFGPTTNVPSPVVDDPGPQRAMVGVPFTLALGITSESLPAVTVTGLPAGLRYEAAAKSITGVPTASVTNRQVVIKAVNANKAPGTRTFALTVDPLPAWAQGAFAGICTLPGLRVPGLAEMTVTAQGRITGKLSAQGTNYIFSAASYLTGEPEFTFLSLATAGKVSMPMNLAVTYVDTAAGGPANLSVGRGSLAGLVKGTLAGAAEDATPQSAAVASSSIQLYRNIWKEAGSASIASNYTGYYTATLPGGADYGSGYLAFTVDKAGGFKAAGKLADGTAVSSGGSLLLSESGMPFVHLYASPSAYQGGFFFGSAMFVMQDGRPGLPLLVPMSSFQWENRSATASLVYGMGFRRGLELSGGWYDTVGNLFTYYTNAALAAATDVDAPTPELQVGTNRYVSACWEPDGVAVHAVLNRAGVLTGLAAPKAGVPAKTGTNTYGYAATTNPVGLTIALTRATGVFKGAFKAWFDYGPSHVAKVVAYEGVLTPERVDPADGIAGRGFFLWPDTGTYKNAQNKDVPFTFNWSYDFKLRQADAVPVVVTSENNGGNVNLSAGEFLQVALPSNPSTGYSWRIVSYDQAVLTKVFEVYQAKVVGGGAVGAGGTSFYQFYAAAAGTTTLTLEYRGPGTPGVLADTFQAQVSVQ